jgi:AmmeMemoRadiSam system protein B
MKLRGLADVVGFAHRERQIEAVAQRIAAQDGARLEAMLRAHGVTPQDRWRLAIAPHDDYAYAGYMYPLALRNIAAPLVVVFGVAHKARLLGLEDRLVFDTFTHWRGPYGDIPVSPLREKLLGRLPDDAYVVSDEMQGIEHSVEAKLPFLQHYNRGVQLVSILVPSMSFPRMRYVASPLARAIADVAKRNAWGGAATSR